MNSQAEKLRQRVKHFAVRVVRFVRTLPREPAGDAIGRQLVRSGTGVSSNYRAACRARSRAEFIAKLGIVVEEADEAEHWVEVIYESRLSSGPELEWLQSESRKLRAIFTASASTARKNHSKSPHP
jgi:four helix bundle protein